MAQLVESGFKRVGNHGLVVAALPSLLLRNIGKEVKVHFFSHVSVYDRGFQGISNLLQISDARGHKDVVIHASLLEDDDTILRAFYEDEAPTNILGVEEGDTLEVKERNFDTRTQIVSHMVDIVLRSGLIIPGFVIEDYSKPITSEFPHGKPERLTAVSDYYLERLLAEKFTLRKYSHV